MKCDKCHQELPNQTFKFPEWNLEVMPIQDWEKPYNIIEIPKGWRLIKIWEFWRLLESEHRDLFLGEYKGKYSFFWCAQTTYAKKNNLSSGFYLGGGLGVDADDGNLAGSFGCGRIVFVRDLK